MNIYKLRELAEKSGLAVAADVKGGYIYPDGMEEFARLIMEECASACNSFDCGKTKGASDLINEWFGIKIND